MAVAFGGTFEALVAGVQGALWALGGAPDVLRSDNLSAATHELKASNGRDLTPRFRAVHEHYRMRSSRITPGRAHENNVAEQALGMKSPAGNSRSTAARIRTGVVIGSIHRVIAGVTAPNTARTTTSALRPRRLCPKLGDPHLQQLGGGSNTRYLSPGQ